MTPSRTRRSRFSSCLAAIGLFAMAVPSAAETAPQVKLRWAELRSFMRPANAGPASVASFTLTNTGPSPLPARGWWLYFNAISGANPLPGDPGAIVEHVNGTLFRIRPAASTPDLAPGASLDLKFEIPEVLKKHEKGPVGPYLVFDARPDEGLAVSDYRQTPFPDVIPIAGADHGVSLKLRPQELFDKYAATKDIPAADLPPVFPTPAAFEARPGTLKLRAAPRIIAPAALVSEARFAETLFAPLHLPKAREAPTLRLAIGAVPGQTSPEAYQLLITPDGVTLLGASSAGVYYGLQSLSQRLPTGAVTEAELPALILTDAPRFAVRAFAMDVARNFQPKAQVLRVLDLMARYKLNRLHLHLSDDEGWRLQIRELPELTDVGARRGHSATSDDRLSPAHGSGPSVSDPHGSGFYTEADYVEIVRYAHERHIEVLPEIEMPGHARAAVMAMQARYRHLRARGEAKADADLLSDPQDRSQYQSAQLYTDNVINPGLTSTYHFIDTVVGRVAALHREAEAPLRNIHMGADELAHGAWTASPAASRILKALGLKSTDDLWDHFYDRVEQIVRAHGAALSGWEELGVRKQRVDGALQPRPNPHFVGHGFTLHVWNNLEGSEDLGYRLANAGYDVVLAPVTNLYFDLAQSRDQDEPGHDWAGLIDLDQVQGFDPLQMIPPTAPASLERLNAKGMAHVIGLEGTLFSETVRDESRLNHMLAPRILALAERAWSPEPAAGAAQRDEDWSRFASQLGNQVLPRLDALSPDLNYRIARPGLSLRDGVVRVNQQLPGQTLRYTTDGTEPSTASPQVTDGQITARGRITVRAFTSTGRAGPISLIDNP
jgi:hexosaminidase